MDLIRTDLRDDPAVEPALARIILEQVSSGERPATIHLSRLGRVVAFGRRDTVAPGYEEAVRVAHDLGFRAMERITGGRVAAHTEGTLVLALTTPEVDPGQQTSVRFRRTAELVRDALSELGVDARIGQIPGEYCPGEWSINGSGKIKLAGAGQRLVKGGVHLAFVVVATESDALREVLDPVHRALDLPWDPTTAGSVADLAPGTTLDGVEEALLTSIGGVAELRPVELDSDTLELARARSDCHRPPADWPAAG